MSTAENHTVENTPTRSGPDPKPPSALDRLIISDAETQLTNTQSASNQDILILDDPTGHLTRWALTHTAPSKHRVISRQRSYTDALTLHHTFRKQDPDAATRLIIAGLDQKGQIDPSTFSLYNTLTTHHFKGTLALGHLPKSHAALADLAHDFARYQAEQGSEATVLLGGNTKHMTPTFNQTLARNFTQVQGLYGKGKHRCLRASSPTPSPAPPRLAGPLQAVGGVFSAGKADLGGQLLATCLLAELGKQSPTQPLTLIDLGCGNGSVTHQTLQELAAGIEIKRVWATDLDVDAVRSASLNLGKDPRVQISWDDAGSRLPRASAHIVLLNPPFHTGTALDLSLVGPLLDAALSLLVPGGQLFLVHNSHARYRQQVEARFEQVKQVKRTPTFTVLAARAPQREEKQ